MCTAESARALLALESQEGGASQILRLSQARAATHQNESRCSHHLSMADSLLRPGPSTWLRQVSDEAVCGTEQSPRHRSARSKQCENLTNFPHQCLLHAFQASLKAHAMQSALETGNTNRLYPAAPLPPLAFRNGALCPLTPIRDRVRHKNMSSLATRAAGGGLHCTSRWLAHLPTPP